MSTNAPGQPEYLGPDRPESGDSDAAGGGGGRRGMRLGILAGVAAAVVVIVGAGAYGLMQLMSGGSSPASAVPASAIGYVSLDLDPSASQKIEAIKILRKFPAIRDELKIGSRDDVRKRIFEEITDEGDCKDLEYKSDVEPWIGERIAVAAVPGSKDKVLPLVALQVSDEKKAKAGVRKLEKCGSEDPLGIAFVGDYMLLSEKQAEVDAMAKSAESATLEDDDDFKTAMDRTGDPGIVAMYASKDAPDAIAKAEGTSGSDESEQLDAAFKGFEGAAGVFRFKDGAVEAEFSSKGLAKGFGAGSDGPDVGTLPSTTAAVLSFSLQDGWFDGSLDKIKEIVGESEFDDAMTQGEQETGLNLPEDIETLLGDGLSISIDSSADLKALTESPDPSDIPAGIRIKGDADKITAIIDKLKTVAGPDADLVEVRSKGDLVAVGTDADYVESLLEEGGLGSTKSFESGVPEADKATAVFFVNFDAGDGWAERLADQLSGGDPEAAENVAPLNAFGVSSWQDDDEVQHALLRLTTD